jgi:uncharacterized protein (TIGR00255 family)
MKSMTGYGRAQGTVAQHTVTVEVRCTNHRYKDLRLHFPRGWMALEVPAENLIRAWVGRGRVECALRSGSGASTIGSPQIDWDNAQEYIRLYRQLAQHMEKELGHADPLRLDLIARSEGVVVFGEGLSDLEAAWGALKTLMEAALKDCDRMRTNEGTELWRELEKRLASIQALMVRLHEVIPEEGRELYQRTTERVRQLAGQTEVTEERLVQEIAVMAERMDVTEELTRLESHLNQCRNLLKRSEPIGREFDFLLQEMNREANTLCSKMHSAEIMRLGVSLKAEIEKMREQVQNVE